MVWSCVREWCVGKLAWFPGWCLTHLVVATHFGKIYLAPSLVLYQFLGWWCPFSIFGCAHNVCLSMLLKLLDQRPGVPCGGVIWLTTHSSLVLLVPPLVVGSILDLFSCCPLCVPDHEYTVENINGVLLNYS